MAVAGHEHHHEPAATTTGAAVTAPQPLLDAVRTIEESEQLDGAASALGRVAEAVVRPGTVHDLLTGTWLGHAVHPLLTDVPIGSWTSASVLDFVGGRSSRTASRRLVALGNLAAVPTVATGLAELLHLDRTGRRVGVVHAGANALGLLLYMRSYRARRRGRHVWGAVLALAGASAASAGGYLGGHLVIARKAGTRDERFVEPVA